MDIARLFADVAGVPLSEAATRFAVAGVPVFPCVLGGKRPLVEHGFHEATTRPEQIEGWWRRWPDANIGVPTGAASGFDVVDVDRKPDGDGFDGFQRAREAGLVPGPAALVRTPSGGLHAYFRSETVRAQPSRQAARAHIDFRGHGGYVIVPPSAVTQPDGGARRYLLTAGPDAMPGRVDAGALREFLDPRQPARFRRRSDAASRTEDVERLAGWVAALGEGERNRGLFWAACRMAEAGADPATTLDALAPAAEQAGLPAREVVSTVNSAYRTVTPASSRSVSVRPRAATASSSSLVGADRRALS